MWFVFPLLVAFLALPAGAHAQELPQRGPSSAAKPAIAPPPTESGWRPVIEGKLANGLRYAILPRPSREPGVAMFSRVSGGFLAERRPGERGVAHLIEHLIFHSPTRTAPNALRRFREIGMPLTLQEPAGGTTSWRESDYFVVSRTTKPADLAALLGLFREVFSELTLRADAVDSQRADVMREMSDKNLGNDIYAAYIAAIAPGSPTDVIDAQNSDDVPTASIETVRALYHQLYRPENTTVVLVGNVDGAELRTLIAQQFGSWRGMGPGTRRTPPPVFQADRIAPISFSTFKYGRHVTMMTGAMPLQPPPPSRGQQADAKLMDMLAMRAVNARLAQTQRDAPIGRYGVFIETGEQGHRLINIWGDFAPGQWRAATATLAKTTCDLATVGFSDREWADAKKALLDELAGRANVIATTPNFEVARELADAVTYGRFLMPPSEMLRHAQARLPALSAQEGSAWWRNQWSGSIRHIRVETTELARVENPEIAIRKTVDDAVGNPTCRVR